MVRRAMTLTAMMVLTLASATVVTAEGYPTIDGQFSGTGALGPAGVLDLTVTGRGGVPAAGVDAVALNVTVTGSTSESFLTVYPTGAVRPTASNLNFRPGQTVPNMVVAKVGTNGQVSIFNLAGNVEVIVDVLGWFPSGGSFTSLSPARLLDSRPGQPTVDGSMSGTGQIASGQTHEVPVTGRGGVPLIGVDSVALNVTAAGPSSDTYLTLWPSGTGRPTASNLNVVRNETRPNMVIAKVGAAGTVSVFNFSGSTDVIIDVLGWFPSGGAFTSVTPARMLDSRAGGLTVDGGYSGTGKLGAAGILQLPVTDRGGVPASGVGAVAVNVTETGASAESYLTVWPTGAARPSASNLNYTAGQTAPNMAIVPVGAGGQISLFNFAGSTDVIVDVLGWFPTSGGLTGLTPARLLDTRTVAPVPPTIVTLRPGTLVVGIDVAPGRYAANAKSGCYWERLKGFGGTLDDILANDFQSFTGRAIVDILPTDVGFKFNAACGNFQTYAPPASPAPTIVAGSHVVGADVVAGTYVTSTGSGCYWERVRSFGGGVSTIIANDFVPNAGQVIVTIASSDVGFTSDAQCGVWTRL